ncbi:hypothetical protein EJ08DRAFT_153147 [Tothia fuscella]|uniref:ZZ-type domain-containing protein n=1 Tax=Tothia fuscella TaxID=1048955 RepID=A0A9P4U506_9PEZI|nr:hypothetical protein EJ08DRAFT_153147 [Tothia fuscella]
MATNGPATSDTLIGVKISIQGSNRKFKLPLHELTPQVLPGKLRSLLEVPHNQTVVFERYSDSAAAYVTLDPANVQVYKTLFRAAKAKGKLRLRAVVTPDLSSNILPSLNNLGMSKMAFASSFPEFVRFGSEVTLNSTASANTATPTAQSGLSTESLVTPASAESAAVEETTPPRSCSAATRLTRESYFNELASIARQREMAFRLKQPQATPAPAVCSSWSVFCNNCDNAMDNAHYHCNVCDDGDYDLCESCVNKGVHCPGDNHWLIKRFVKNGHVINSTTETLVPKAGSPSLSTPVKSEMPGAFTDEKKVEEEAEVEDESSRTCNSCVKGEFCPFHNHCSVNCHTEYPDSHFVTCLNCEDFDLCMSCHQDNKHGHHPGHAFEPTTADTPMGPFAEFLCAPGRNVKHAAICDGCDKPIFGVRHKCLNCPDWDYCSECFKNATFIHPLHRFAPIYEPISMPRQYHARHAGIYCDGPLCQNKHDYITGVRYKCAICHDTDFCDGCEAYPHNKHNRTHPMIMFKTAVRGVGITTMVEDKTGAEHGPLGDRSARKPAPKSSVSPVQTIVDVKPIEVLSTHAKVKVEKIEIKDLLAEPIQEMSAMPDLLPTQIEEPVRVPLLSKAPSAQVDINQLRAAFIRETVPDSTVMQKDQTFVQVWTLRNPGPVAWPAGCSVRYTGGDNMLNVDKTQPASTRELTAATETNTIARPVEVGEEIAFRVALKAPSSMGTKISYWRLKTADGQAFGHRLWCHIVVADSAEAETASSPPAMSPPFASLTVPTVERSEEVGRPAHQDFLRTVLQQRVDRRRELDERAQQLAKALQDARNVQEMQRKDEEEQKSNRAQMLRNLSSEIHAVEVQHKARFSAACAAIEAARIAQVASPAPAPVSELPAATPESAFPFGMHDIRMQLQRLEQINNARLEQARKDMASRNETTSPVATTDAKEVNHAKELNAEGFQKQLQHLERINNARLVQERKEMASRNESSPVATTEAKDSTAEDFRTELQRLQLLNNARLVQSRKEMAARNESSPVATTEAKELNAEGSQMIFPTLEKESPASSTYNVVATTATPATPRMAPVMGSAQRQASVASVSAADESDADIFEDAESVELESVGSSEDGFLTDEEYDILDASDEEFA